MSFLSRRFQSSDAFNRMRHYFYWVDVHGRLYSIMTPDARAPTGPTFLRDSKQLKFFFKHLKQNDTGLYLPRFPFVSLCGSGKWQELNFVACEDRPIVFQDLVFAADDGRPQLTWATARVNLTDHFTVDFDPARLYVRAGRLYFLPREDQALPGGGVGLIRSELCFSLGQRIEYRDDETVDLEFNGVTFRLKKLPLAA